MKASKKMKASAHSPGRIDQFDDTNKRDHYVFVLRPEFKEKAKGLSRRITHNLVKSSRPIYAVDPLYFTSVQRHAKVGYWRKKSVAWYNEVASCLELPMQYVETAVNILDRYLSKKPVILETFRLAAAAAASIAGKMYTQRFFSSSRLVELCGTQFTVVDLVAIEKIMLFTLEFSMIPCTVVELATDFIRICTVGNIDSVEEHDLCERIERILEISCGDEEMLHFPIICRAWAVILCAFKIQRNQSVNSKKKRSFASMALPAIPDKFVEWRNFFNDSILLPNDFVLDIEPSMLKCEARMSFLWEQLR